MNLREQIIAAVPHYEDAELELFGQKFPVRVLLVSMSDFNARMKHFGETGPEDMAAEISTWFLDSEGGKVFHPDDLDKLPAKAVKDLISLFTKVNTGAELEKNA